MGAPKGNQYAKGNKGGRPQKWFPEIEAELLLEWADDEDNWILAKFAVDRGYPPEDLYHMAQESKVLNHALLIARSKIAIRRQIMANLGELNQSIYHRYASFYDHSLKAHDKEMKASSQEALGRGMATPINLQEKGKMDVDPTGK